MLEGFGGEAWERIPEAFNWYSYQSIPAPVLRRAFVAGAGVRSRESREVGELTGQWCLRAVAHKVAPLGANAGRDGFPERFTREIAVVVVGQIFQFDFVGRADQPVGKAGETRGRPAPRFFPVGP